MLDAKSINHFEEHILINLCSNNRPRQSYYGLHIDSSATILRNILNHVNRFKLDG